MNKKKGAKWGDDEQRKHVVDCIRPKSLDNEYNVVGTLKMLLPGDDGKQNFLYNEKK